MFVLANAVGFWLFSRGFLLTRMVLPDHSLSSVLPYLPPSEPAAGSVPGHAAEDSCGWYPAKFDRTIILIIDAMRIDFATWSDELNSAFGQGDGQTAKGRLRPYHNNLPIIGSLTAAHPEQAMLYRFRADPPTTTLQRLKGLTTGQLPTFIDAGSNFAGSAIDEDNWLQALRWPKRNLVFLGDDTWTSLFSKELSDTISKESNDTDLNVWDLHTVDDGVLIGLKQLHEDWDVIIAHCLGVDHCGHRFGPDHPAISNKLEQMNQAIELIVDSINRSEKATALYVFGDHGMDPKGDHGGDSPREVDAALWIYSNKNDDYWSKDSGYLFKPTPLRSIPQIDLVSSLSLSLGLPVPFNSLGAVIPEMFASDDSVGGEWGLLRALRLNAAQVMRYLTAYMSRSHSHGFSDEVVQLWKDMYRRAEKSYQDLEDLAAKNRNTRDKYVVSEAEEAAAAQYYAFLRIMLGTLRQMWAQFDPALIITGLCILMLSIAALVSVYVRSRQTTLESVVSRSWATCLSGGVIGMVAARALSVVLVASTSSHISLLESTAAGLTIGLLLSFCVSVLRSEKGDSDSSPAFTSGWISPDAASFLNYAACVMAILHGFTFTSNSYTFNEDSIVLYLAQSLTVCVLAVALRSISPSGSSAQRAAGQRALWCSLAILVLNRVSSYSTVCREEQLPGCTPTFYGSPSASISSIPLAAANALMVWLVPFVLQRFLQRSRSDKAMIAKLWIGIGMRISMGMAAAYWLLDSIDGQLSLETAGSSSELRIVLARMAVGIAVGGGLAAWVASPFCLDVAVADTPQPAGSASKSRAKSAPAASQKTAIILGFGNAYGAAYLVFTTVVFCVLYLVQQPMGGIMLSLLFLKIVFCAELFDALRDALSNSGVYSAPLLPAQITMLALISYLDYFSTGHQFTLVSIQWSTAFVGVREMQLVLCGVIVGLNTLGSFILTALGVPLVVLWNESLGSQLLRIAPGNYFARVAGAGAAYSAYHALVATTTAVFAAWFRRHLMVWKIFAPRFMFSAPVFLTTAVAIFVVATGFAAARVLRMGLKVGNVQALVAQKIMSRS
ncbi:hypothetical protein GQ54DRAFT_256974 [Martensiomyces pterosporus]|nr:hypothetical protein GQ54DRAFT_256974 [Martensiomyces pterosporus]